MHGVRHCPSSVSTKEEWVKKMEHSDPDEEIVWMGLGVRMIRVVHRSQKEDFSLIPLKDIPKAISSWKPEAEQRLWREGGKEAAAHWV